MQTMTLVLCLLQRFERHCTDWKSFYRIDLGKRTDEFFPSVGVEGHAPFFDEGPQPRPAAGDSQPSTGPFIGYPI